MFSDRAPYIVQVRDISISFELNLVKSTDN